MKHARRGPLWMVSGLLALALAGCGGGESGGDASNSTPPPTGQTATVTGTVSGTRIVALNAGNQIVAQDDTAGKTPNAQGRYSFSLSKIPLETAVRLFFVTRGVVHPLSVGNPATNQVTFQNAATVDLGFVTADGVRATAERTPAGVTLGPDNPAIPANIIPAPATISVSTPTPASGTAILHFEVKHFAIGGQGGEHLLVRLGSDATPHHFYNAPTNQVLYQGVPTPTMQWQGPASLRFTQPPGTYQLRWSLATAGGEEYLNAEAATTTEVTLVAPPSNPPTLTLTSPAPNAELAAGPVTVSFVAQMVTLGGQGQPHVHVYLDGDPTPYEFFTGSPGQVLQNGQPSTVVQWANNSSILIPALTPGLHQIRAVIAGGSHEELANAEANPPTRSFTILAPPGTGGSVTISSPTEGSTLQTSVVIVTVAVQTFTIGLLGQPHLHFYLDNDPVPYEFLNGTGIFEENGVLQNGGHTHLVHWKSPTTFQINALRNGAHAIRAVLVDGDHQEMSQTSQTRSFSVEAPVGGDFSLQPMIQGLNLAVAFAPAPDGLVYYTEKNTGNIRVINGSAGWTLQNSVFAQVPVFLEVGGFEQDEEGLVGITLDPSYANNGYVYVFHTAPNPVRNRIVRIVKTTNGQGDAVGTFDRVVLDNLPAAKYHNGGTMTFGPDGKLYVFVGDNYIEFQDRAQQLGFLNGKFLRVNADGSIPGDNPFPGSPVYSLGHRNSFGFTFHPHTGDLWQGENGAETYDELNRILSGGNYGWPFYEGVSRDSRYLDPVHTITPQIGPTGLAAVREDSAYPERYHNNLLLVNFNNGQIRRLILGGTEFQHLADDVAGCDCGQPGLVAAMHGYNVPGQDGYIYVSNAQTIFRVLPLNP